MTDLAGLGAAGLGAVTDLAGLGAAGGGVATDLAAPGPAEVGPALHLLLRVSDADAVARHRVVARRAGAVWWPRYGAGRRRPTRREVLLQGQVAEGVETWVYLLDGSGAYCARLEALCFDPSAVDPGRLAAGFDPARPVWGLFLLGGFTETTRHAVVEGLVLDSAPVPGGLRKSLRGSQATLYVRRLGAGPARLGALGG